MSNLKQLGSIEFRGVLPMFIEDELIKFLNFHFPNSTYDLDAGMTKTTIILKEQKDWVYKIPHSGIYIPKCKCFDDEPKELYFSLLKENSCETEMNFYNQIPKDHLKCYFLPLYHYLETSDIIIYKQQKVMILPEAYDKKTSKYSCIPNIILNALNFDISHYWLNLAIYKYGIASVLDLIHFLNNNLSIAKDLSNNNLGIDSYGNPVIVDYSGFYSVEYQRNSN